MIYTKPEEIYLVRKNLIVFDNRLPQNLINRLLNKQIRIKQHGLFFSLCDRSIYPFLLDALENIKKYNKDRYFPKAISKLVNNPEWFFQMTAVAEIIVAGYYFNKFFNSSKFDVEWERKTTKTGKSVDISILDKGKNIYINIEVTGKMQDERMRYHSDLRYKTKLEIEKRTEKFSDQKYSYMISILSKRKHGSEKLFEQHINEFVDFVLEMRKNGTGEYSFIVNGKKLATVQIKKLKKLNREYVSYYKDIWFGTMKDHKRVRNVIINKAKDQLPKGEINFICFANLFSFDDIDFQEAFWGKETHLINFRTGKIERVSRKPDGVISILKDKDYSAVYGLIYSKWDYSKKKLIINPFIECNNEIIEIIR